MLGPCRAERNESTQLTIKHAPPPELRHEPAITQQGDMAGCQQRLPEVSMI